MIAYATIPAERCSDYSEPRYPLTSEPQHLCECKALATDQCRTCGEPLCASHARRCEEVHCFDANHRHCSRCVVSIDRMELCKRHAGMWAGDEAAESSECSEESAQ